MGSRTMFSPAPTNLDDHTIEGLAGGLEQPGQEHLPKTTHREDHDDGQIVHPIGDNFRVIHLDRKVQPGPHCPHQANTAKLTTPRKMALPAARFAISKFFSPSFGREEH